jgi:hypothetical protein
VQFFATLRTESGGFEYNPEELLQPLESRAGQGFAANESGEDDAAG